MSAKNQTYFKPNPPQQIVQKLRSLITTPLFLLATSFPVREKSRKGNTRDKFDPRVEIYQFPPDKDCGSSVVHSDMYQTDIPQNLYEAGIEELDVKTGKAVLAVNAIMDGAMALQESASGYCELDLQDRVIGSYKRLGEHLENVDETALTKTLGTQNPIVQLVQSAKENYSATVGRKSNLETLTESHPNDPTAVGNRYFG